MYLVNERKELPMKKLCKNPLLLFLLLACVLWQTGCGRKIDAASLKKELNIVSDSPKRIRNASTQSGWEADCVAQKYDMTLQLDTDSNTIAGYEDVVIMNASNAALDRIGFRYFTEAISPDSEITSVRIADADESLPVNNSDDHTTLFASLPGDGLAPGETTTLRIEFSTVIPKMDDRFGYHEEQGLGKMYLLTFWAPQLAFCENGVWDESPYFDAGESTYNMMSDYTVQLTAPSDYMVAASGRQTTNGETTTIDAPKVREMAIVLCNYMERTTETVNGVSVNMYRPDYDKYNTLYDVVFANAKEAVKLFDSTVGPYIYDELDVVPAFIAEGGMEMPGLVLEGLPPEGRDVVAGDYYYAAITVAHEVAHQWFYCAIGNDQYNEPWLDESFATYYGSYVYHKTVNEALVFANEEEKKMSDDDVNMLYDEITNPSAELYWGEIKRDDYINLPCGHYDDDGYVICVYDMGGYFLYCLSARMGDSFNEMISEWYQENKYGIVHGNDFVKLVLAYDSSDEVKALLTQYLSDEYLP